jgi:predicted transcriptional regulator
LTGEKKKGQDRVSETYEMLKENEIRTNGEKEREGERRWVNMKVQGEFNKRLESEMWDEKRGWKKTNEDESRTIG